MADVKWIKLKVGMFDGMSFKKIKKAKIGGETPPAPRGSRFFAR